MGPVRLLRDGSVYERVTVKFRRQAQADEDRARLQDAMIRTHGFPTARGLTSDVARRQRRWRCYVRRAAVPGLKRRLGGLLAEKAVAVWIGGKRIP